MNKPNNNAERQLDKYSVKETQAQPQAAEVRSAQQTNNLDEFLTWGSSEENQLYSGMTKSEKNEIDAKNNKFLGWCRAKLNDASDKNILRKRYFRLQNQQ